jgi:hypothetical protein
VDRTLTLVMLPWVAGCATGFRSFTSSDVQLGSEPIGGSEALTAATVASDVWE